MPSKRSIRSLLAAVLACAQFASVAARSAAAPGQEVLNTASQLVRASGSSGGVCAVLGSTDAELALALAKQGSFTVHCLRQDRRSCDALRAAIRARGMYGTVSADVLSGDRLPYVPNLVNILVVDSHPGDLNSGFSPEEALRVLAPLGVACIGASAADDDRPKAWTRPLMDKLRALGVKELSVVEAGGSWVCARKPWPADIDEWTHYLHGADGNPVARDRVVGPPRHFQWTAGPFWLRSHETDSSLSTLVTARGRLFAIVDEAPISLPGDHALPDKWSLVARDAFNGVPLWKTPIRRWGWREWKKTWFSNRPGDMPLDIRKRLVAVGDRVYVTLGHRAPASELDARTGEILKTYAGAEPTSEILYADGTLILSVLVEDRLKVMAYNAASGSRLWVTENAYRGSTIDYLHWGNRYAKVEAPKLDACLNTATDGKVVALIDGAEIVGLDFRTGAEKWRASFPTDDLEARVGGLQPRGALWNGTMIVCDGVVLHASPSKLAAFSADTGKLLWTQPKRYIGHLWYAWKDVFVINGLAWTWSAEVGEGHFNIGRKRKQRTLHPRTVNGYDLKTGALKKQVPLGTIFNAHHHHRCYRNKATLRYILASRRGTEFVDLEEGKHTVHNWVRGACHVGMMPANGLQYAPPHPCACYIDEKLNGMVVLAPAGSRTPMPADGPASGRLERGPAYGQAAPLDPGGADPEQDWPAFRHDSLRTGSVNTQVPDDAATLWRVEVGGKASPPVVACGRLFTALVDEHHVVCLDVRDGARLWEFAAGARIDSPPTHHAGAVLFGSADGWVYCLRAADGQLAWRFRAAPARRLIGAFGQLESAWPVHGSVLVQDDPAREGRAVAYFAAGRSSQLDGGIRLYGVDAATGELRCQTKLAGPDYAVGDFEENFKLPMGALPDILRGDGTKIYMRTATFDAELNPESGSTSLQLRSGFLDDTYFKRVPWRYGRNWGRLIVHDDQAVYCVRMFDSLRGLDPNVYFTPGSKGYLLFANSIETRKDTWSHRIPVRVRAMALTAGRLFVAGPPDLLDANDPLGAFEGRKGGWLYVFDSASGEKLAEHELPSPPVLNGVAAANGRLYLAAEDGAVTCFGKRQ